MTRFLERFCRIVEILAGLLLGFVTLLVVVSTAGRYLFTSPVPDAFDLSRLMIGACVMWGFASVGYRGGHIKVDLFADAGVPRAAVRCVAPLDTIGFDLTDVAPGKEIYLNAFGTDPGAWPASSPQLQVTEGEDLPAFLLITQQRATRRGPNEAFRDALVDAGGAASVVTVPLDHAGINQAVGRSDDRYVTDPLVGFLGPCLLA